MSHIDESRFPVRSSVRQRGIPGRGVDRPNARFAAARSRAEQAKLRMLFLATTFFIVVTVIRPQDIIPVLGVIRPGVLAVLFLYVALLRYGKIPHRRDPIFMALLVFVGAIACGIVVVVNHNNWFWRLWVIVNYVAAFGIAVPILLTEQRYRNFLLGLLLLAFGIAAAYAITHSGLGQGEWLGDENDVAAALGMAFCFAVWYALARGERPYKRLGYVVAGMAAIGIVIANSRGGMLGFIAGCLGIAYFSGRMLASLVVCAALAAAVYPFLPEETKTDFTSISDKNDSTRVERIYSWKLGMDMFWSSPVLGVGAGNYPWRVDDFQRRDEELHGRRSRPLAGRVAHSTYVTVLCETGLLGTIPYAATILMALMRCRRTIYDGAAEDWQRFLACAAGSALLAYGVSAAFITATYWLPIFLLVSLTIVLGQQGKPFHSATAAASRGNR